FAALVAAIASSLSSMANSISTIFTVDLYKRSFKKEASETEMVFVGRSVAIVAMTIAAFVAVPLLGKLDQAFQYIQEFTGFFTPGIVAIFILGFFWKKATAHSALAAAISSAVLSFIFYNWWPALPFMDRVGVVFLLCMVIAIVITLIEKKGENENAISLEDMNFETSSGFNLATLGVVIVLCALYVTWW
ncbi:MAG: hypothetical protein OQK04_12855, partial [Kangiellaceae bacterium]|nr:hypothetical protein [Kangiellaceae bacterium]